MTSSDISAYFENIPDGDISDIGDASDDEVNENFDSNIINNETICNRNDEEMEDITGCISMENLVEEEEEVNDDTPEGIQIFTIVLYLSNCK